MVNQPEDAEEEEEERVRTHSRTAHNYWLCQTTSVMSTFQPSAWSRIPQDRKKQGQIQGNEFRVQLRVQLDKLQVQILHQDRP